MDSRSVLGFAPKKAKSVFGFENPDLDFPKNTPPKSQRRTKKQLGIVFFNILIIFSKFGILIGGNVSTH